MGNDLLHSTSSFDEHPSLTWNVCLPEVLQKVFLYLKVRDLLSARLVCKHWRQVSFQPCFDDNILVSIQDLGKSGICDLIESGICISNLKFVKKDTIDTIDFWPHFGPSLKALTLDSLVFDAAVNLPMVLKCCPNLEVLCLVGCAGLELGLDRPMCAAAGLKELQILSCNEIDDWIVSLVSLMALPLTKFKFSPSIRDLQNGQLIEVVRCVAGTLTELDIYWRDPPNEDFRIVEEVNQIFGMPDLKLKKVTLMCNFIFSEITTALLSHHSESLEEMYFYDYDLLANEQLQWYLSQRLPRLRKFTAVGLSFNDGSISSLLSLLDGRAESRTQLREIVVDDMEDRFFVRLTRKTEIDRFDLHELVVSFDNHVQDFDAVHCREVVSDFLREKGSHLLTKLHLANVDLSQHGLADLVFDGCVNLMDLSLKRCNLSDAFLMNGVVKDPDTLDADFDAILEGNVVPIMNLEYLEVLVLSGNEQLTGLSVTRIIKFPRLKSLTLNNGNAFCDDRFAQIAINNPCLETVKFSQIDLTDELIIEFAQNAPKLVSLNIKDNPMLTNYAIGELAEHRMLKELNVEGCPDITDEFVRFMQSRNTTLRVKMTSDYEPYGDEYSD